MNNASLLAYKRLPDANNAIESKGEKGGRRKEEKSAKPGHSGKWKAPQHNQLQW
jgi:hypothetical protein